MQQSKNLAMMFLLGAFLTGGVLGFSADRYMKRDQVCTAKAKGHVQPAVAALAARLGLTNAQSASVDSILDARSRSYRTVLDPLRAQLDSIKLSSREQIRGVLDEKQKAAFEQFLLEMNDTTRKDDE